MTIKPAAKRAPPDTDGKIENPNGGGVTGDPNNGQQKSPQRRELYEDLSRHRCSPNKSRSKRRDHLHEHHKRERSERSDWNKHAEVANSTAAGTRSLGVGNMLLTNSTGLSLAPNLNVGGAGGVVVVGRNSPGMGDVTSSAATVNMLAGGSSTGSNNAVSMTNVGGNSGVVVGSLSPTHGGCSTATSSTAGSVASSVSNATAAMLQGGIASHIGLKSVEESCSGYNSGDEHMPPKEKTVSAAEWKRRDEQFVSVMSEAGFELRQVEEDGACLFRAISLQIYGDEDAHEIVRQHTMDYIYKNREYFSQFVTEDINSYITRKRRKDSHGNHIEIQAMSEIYARPVEVYCYKSKPINIFNSEQHRNGYAPLRLSYQRMSHYNAIIDPYNATVGVGLGIANYLPTMQTTEAMRVSEQLEIEQTMFEDKLKTTDWEATNEVIEEQVARESYFQWCRENLQKNRAAAVRSATATVTSAQACNNNNNSDIISTQDEVASPSKYAIDNSSGGSGNNSSTCSSGHSPESSEGNSSSSSGGGGLGVANVVSVPPSVLSATRKLNFMLEKQSVSAGAGGIENNSAGAGNSLPNTNAASPGPTSSTTKKLSALAKLQKETSAGYDTDDTDISTNSSLTDGITSVGTGVGCGGGGGGGGDSPQQTTNVRPKKIKTRYISKKRRHEQLMRHGDGSDDTRNFSGGNVSGLDGSSNSGSSSDATPRVHKGAKRDNNTMEPTMAPLSSVVISASEKLCESKLEELPCSSKCAQQPIAGFAANVDVSGGGGGGSSMDTTSAGVAPLSSFYQDLLESSYDNDGFGQLTEAEMLQRAIQLSTQDFIEHQKRYVTNDFGHMDLYREQ